MTKASKGLQMRKHSALHFFMREINSARTISMQFYEFKMN